MFRIFLSFLVLCNFFYSMEIKSYIRSWPLGNTPSETLKGQYFDGNKIKKVQELTLAFAKINENGSIYLVDIEPDSKGNYGFKTFKTELFKIRQNNKNAKITLAIGGWGADGFSDLGVNKNKLKSFLDSVKEKILTYGFDGIEINWLYPVNGGNGSIKSRPSDKETFTLLISSIRKLLNYLTLSSKKQYLLSFGVPANKEYINWVNLKATINSVDYITVQAYDFDYSYTGKTAYASNLYSTDSDISISHYVDFFLKNGIPKEKLVLGAPLYGKAWKIGKNQIKLFNVPYEKNLYPNGIAYDLIKKLLSFGFKEKFDDLTKSAYIYENDTLISYENYKSIKEKMNYAKKIGLRGIKFWEYGNNYNGDLIDFSLKYNNQ